MTEDRIPNRLINENSPYLLQHAYNPVDWFPWGEEAFEKARYENKPVFLSIGYSTCHWCHVLSEESFEDLEAARLLNRNFISIKVDREERPDIDAVYMNVCQMMTGSGGWPLTILMAPDQKPFFAGTYFPKHSRYGSIGIIELLEQASRQWQQNRPGLLHTAERITGFLQNNEKSASKTTAVTKEILKRARDVFYHSYDRRWGGFGEEPKFPAAHNLLFLLNYAKVEQDQSTMEMVEHTLEQLYRGGIFDHIGGGFSRYSTDEKWLVPHFEKMLYDNALLAYTYLEIYQISKRLLYKTAAERIMDYVLKELTDWQGGFYCGQDADSEGVEGKYYTFTQQELMKLLGKNNGEQFCAWYGISEEGNFEGKNIPNLIDNPCFEETPSNICKMAEKVYHYRLERTKLHKDDKILTSWNALMIAALAKASCLNAGGRYLEAAKRAQVFLSQQLVNDKGRLMIRWRDGEAANHGQLDDYSFYAFALLELYQTTFDTKYLLECVRISEEMIRLFWDEEEGGFYLYAWDSEQLISRPKEFYDGAMPSGNSVAAVVLGRLARLTGELKWQQCQDKLLDFLSGMIAKYPSGCSFTMLAVMETVYPSRELVCVTAKKDISKEFTAYLKEHPVFNLSVIVKTPWNHELSNAAPFTDTYPVPEEGELYYLCQNGSCEAPAGLKKILQTLQKESAVS